jgi:preprotein translocase YajC subunit
MKELRPGDRVIIAGGIYGQIESLTEETAILRIESGATMKVARGSIIGRQELEEPSKGTF